MNRQRGQAAVEFALMAPIVLFIVMAAFYGGAMFIQFLNFNNEVRTIARQIAVADDSDRYELITKYNSIGEQEVGLYSVKLTVLPTDNDGDDIWDDVTVRCDFNRPEGSSIFGFPPAHFATSYTVPLEN